MKNVESNRISISGPWFAMALILPLSAMATVVSAGIAKPSADVQRTIS